MFKNQKTNKKLGKVLALSMMVGLVPMLHTIDAKAQYYPPLPNVHQQVENVQVPLQRQIYGGEILPASQILSLSQRIRMNDQLLSVAVLAQSTGYYNAMASLLVNGRVVGMSQAITPQMRKVILQIPPSQLAMQNIQVQIQGNAFVKNISAEILRQNSSPIPPVPGQGRAVKVDAPINQVFHSWGQVQVLQALRMRAMQPVDGLRLLRVEVKARTQSYYGARVQLMINGQPVGAPQQVTSTGRMLRFDTLQFKSMIIGMQIRNISLSVQGDALIESVSVRGTNPPPGQGTGYGTGYGTGHGGGTGYGTGYGTGHGGGTGQGTGYGTGHGGGTGYGTGNATGSGTGHGTGHGGGHGNGTGNGTGHGTGHGGGHGNGTGSSVGSGTGHGGGTGTGTGNGSGSGVDPNAKSVELEVMQAFNDKDKIDLVSLASKLPKAMLSRAIDKIEISGVSTTEKKARVIVRNGSSLIASVRFETEEETKEVDVDDAEALSMQDLSINVKEGLNVSTIKITFAD